jgi:hypothetical protein
MPVPISILGRIGRWLMTWLTPLLGVGLALIALVALGKLARDRLYPLDRYTLRFTEIDCTPPAGQDRGDFLEEVQYLSNAPDRLHLLDHDLTSQLAGAFARHPWVERVEAVEVVPPRRVLVRLVYRTPVLAVPLPGLTSESGDWIRVRGSTDNQYSTQPGRAVDGRGIVLPTKSIGADLPVLYGKVRPPTGPAGTRWGDPGVEAAAQTAAFLRPYRDRFRFEDIAITADGVVLSNGPSTTHILWGKPPGKEPAGEASADRKMERLLDYCQRSQDLDRGATPYELDLRPGDRPLRRPLR